MHNRETMIFLFLLLLIDLAAAGNPVIEVPQEHYYVTWESLLELLRTSQDIWLKKRSGPASGNADCFRWKKTYLNNSDYYFQKWYRHGSATRGLHERAKLINTSTNPEMIILNNRNIDNRKGKRYILHYWDKNEHCALFRLPVAGREDPKWEQYVWRDRVQDSPICDNAFAKVEFSSYWVFKTECL
uniref:Lipocalin n=1 Tax=Rhipicephalus zambeziensis TaxID=60191 RepID=A0A224YLI4_9ACAR